MYGVYDVCDDEGRLHLLKAEALLIHLEDGSDQTAAVRDAEAREGDPGVRRALRLEEVNVLAAGDAPARRRHAGRRAGTAAASLADAEGGVERGSVEAGQALTQGRRGAPHGALECARGQLLPVHTCHEWDGWPS